MIVNSEHGKHAHRMEAGVRQHYGFFISAKTSVRRRLAISIITETACVSGLIP